MNHHLITRAQWFAIEAHESIGQRRKWTLEPYWHHPYRVVVKLLATGIEDPAILAAAWLHDVVEDTPVTPNEILRTFGKDVHQLVMEVTNIARSEDGNRAARHRINIDHLANASAGGQTIKLADTIDNLSSIIQYGGDFAIVYLREKATLLPLLSKGNHRLREEAGQIVAESLSRLGTNHARTGNKHGKKASNR